MNGNNSAQSYQETQYSPWSWIIAIVVVVLAAILGLNQLPAAISVTLIIAIAVDLFIGFSFAYLQTADTGTTLLVRFGPILIASTEIVYAEIVDVVRERTTILDGWGLRWVRGGWLWNLWGFDCVKIVTDSKTVRIGTQKPDELLEFLILQTKNR